MFNIKNNRPGDNEYQTKTEERLSAERDKEFADKFSSVEKFEKYCDENNLPKTADTFKEKYLNSGSSHREAQFLGAYKTILGLDKYSKDAYLKVMNNEIPISKKELSKLNPELKVFDSDKGRFTRKSANEKKGLDNVASVPKNVSQYLAIAPKDIQDKGDRAMTKAMERFIEHIKPQIKASTGREEYETGKVTDLFVTVFKHNDTRPGETDKSIQNSPTLHQKILDSIEPDTHYHIEMSQVGIVERTVINKATGKSETIKQALSLDYENLFKNQKENSAVWDSIMNSCLQEEGFVTSPHQVTNPLTGEVTNTYKIEGFTREDELKQTSRSMSIYKEMKRQNKTSDPKLQQQIAKGFKNKKVEFTAEELTNAIKKNTELALGEDKYEKVKKIQDNSTQKYYKTEAKEALSINKLATEGLIKPTEIREKLVRSMMFERTYTSADELNNLVEERLKQYQNPSLYGRNTLIEVKNSKGSLIGYSRMDLAIHERAYVKNIEGLAKDRTNRTKKQIKEENKWLKDFQKEANLKGFDYNSDQKTTMNQVLKLGKEGGNVLMVVGDPGSGKSSSVIKNANALWEHRNPDCNVYGVSVSESATADLQSAGIKKENLLNSAKLIQKAYKKDSEGNYVLNQKFVNENQGALYIFDEYGMSGKIEASLITNLTSACNGSLLLVGDPKQLAPVSAGMAFKSGAETLKGIDGDLVQKLSIIQRQQNEDALKIVELQRDKKIDELFDHLEKKDALVTAKTEKTLYKQIANDFLDENRTTAKLSERFIVAPRNEQIDTLNDVIREKIKKDNLDPNIDFSTEKAINVSRTSGNGVDITRERNFAVGERVVFLQNCQEKNQNGKPVKDGWKIQNSEFGFIKEIKDTKNGYFDLTFDVDGKEIKINTEQYNYFNHSNCVSTHKSQGKTRADVQYLLDPSTNYNNAFVGMSRHTGTKDLVDDEGNVLQKGELGFTAYVLEKNIDEVKQSLTKEQDKFTTIGNQEIDNLVDGYLYDKTRDTNRNTETPTKIQQAINKDEIITTVADSQKIDYVHKIVSNLTAEEKAEIQKVLDQIEQKNKLQIEEQKHVKVEETINPTDSISTEEKIKEVQKAVESLRERNEIGYKNPNKEKPTTDKETQGIVDKLTKDLNLSKEKSYDLDEVLNSIEDIRNNKDKSKLEVKKDEIQTLAEKMIKEQSKPLTAREKYLEDFRKTHNRESSQQELERQRQLQIKLK